jgi:hypothetical protein
MAAARMGRRRQGKQADGSPNSAGIQFQALVHEGKELVPGGELEIAQQRVDVLEELSSRAQGLPDQAILFVYEVQDGVEEEGQQVQAE